MHPWFANPILARMVESAMVKMEAVTVLVVSLGDFARLSRKTLQ